MPIPKEEQKTYAAGGASGPGGGGLIRIGAQVWFWPALGGSQQHQPQEPPWVGTICCVLKPGSFKDPWTVRISGWTPSGGPFHGYEVPYSPTPRRGCWTWPPKPSIDILESYALGT
jgi:hypothetical protein